MYFRLSAIQALSRAVCFMVPMSYAGAHWAVAAVVGFCAALGWEGDDDER